MPIEVLALGAGRQVAKIVASRWLAARADKAAASADLIDLIKTGFPDEIMRRKTENQFESLALSVAGRIQPYARQELRGLDDATREAALLQVAGTLAAADLSDRTLLDIGPDAGTGPDMGTGPADPGPAAGLARRLREKLRGTPPARNAERELGEAGARLYEVVLDECCDCLAHTVIHLPEFTERAAAESLARLSSAIAALETILDRLPVRTLDAPQGDSLDDDFTRRYLASVGESLDRLDLFGVRFERLTRPRTTLSVAYISLNVIDETPGDAIAALPARPGRRDPVPVSEWREERHVGSPLRAEQALSEHQRILIRGEAGSGKSTLLRWLAVTAARGGFTGDLAPLNGHVPFLITLRSHAERGLPLPGEFLDDVSPTLAGIMPDAWAHRQLNSGRALLLVDGIDEIVDEQRERVRAWLGDLARRYPRARVVVTSRPAAAEAAWLREEGFRAAFLEPLSPADVRELVRHWHAAIRDSGDLPCPPERLPSYEAKLLARLESSPHLRALAAAPLLAAMLCALNLDRDTLPRDRMGLYAAAINMLLEIRDAKRGIPSARVLRLERDQKVRLLRDLAWHLSSNDLVELAETTARRLIRERLATMPGVAATADEVLAALLERSGIIREPVPGRIGFVHRTIQEYLTAGRAADLDEMTLLVRNAHIDRWRETIVMAAGHANETQRRELIEGILGRARSEEADARELKLLAAGCLETLPSVPEDLRTALDRCLRDLIPPTDRDEAASLAAVGEPVLRHLPVSLEGLPDETVAPTVRTAWLINGPETLTLLRRYASDAQDHAKTELNTAWDYLDPDEYAERVLSAMPPGGALTVHSPAQLTALAKVSALKSLTVILARPADLSPLSAHAASLRSLRLMCQEPIRDLSTMPGLPALRSLELNISGLTDLGFLNAIPSLAELTIGSCGYIVDYSPLRRLTALETLQLEDCTRLRSLDQLPPLGEVTRLSLTGSRLAPGSLAALVEAAPKVRRLYLNDCGWVDDVTPLLALPDLEHLSIWGIPPGTDLSPLEPHRDRIHITTTRAPWDGRVRNIRSEK